MRQATPILLGILCLLAVGCTIAVESRNDFVTFRYFRAIEDGGSYSIKCYGYTQYRQYSECYSKDGGYYIVPLPQEIVPNNSEIETMRENYRGPGKL